MPNRDPFADVRPASADVAPSRLVGRIAKAAELLATWEVSPSRPEDLATASAVAGFSFGLTACGWPGESNRELANVILALLRANPSLKVCVQWEIADALRERGFLAPLEQVVTPPRFRVEDIQEPESLRKRLAHSVPGTLEAYVRAHVPKFSATMSDEGLCEALNAILVDRGFHKGLPALVKLRTIEGETRELPPPSADLGEFQVMRINRLILESVFARELRAGEYVSTWSVVQGIWRGLSGQTVIVVAHPDHAVRCGVLLEGVLGRRPLFADCRAVPYDPLSAQAWTRTREDFLAYEVGARRAALSTHLREPAA